MNFFSSKRVTSQVCLQTSRLLQQTFVFPQTASSVLTNVALVQWPDVKKGKLWHHRNDTKDKSYKSTEVWTLNRCSFEAMSIDFGFGIAIPQHLLRQLTQAVLLGSTHTNFANKIKKLQFTGY